MSAWLRCRRSAAVAAWSLLACVSAAGAAAGPGWPDGLSVVAQGSDGDWRLHVADASGGLRIVATHLEPRMACWAPAVGRAVYAAADGTIRLAAADGTELVLARPDAERAYTQPCLAADGGKAWAVEMAGGKSIETEIVAWPLPAGAPERPARQPGAQHDPYVAAGRWLVYASVGCSEGCERLLVEIWLRDLLTGEARQLTLLNALSQSPVTDGRRVVFSSNADGAFRLWQVGLDGRGLRRLTSPPADGTANDLMPSLCRGALYFVRRSPASQRVLRLDDNDVLHDVSPQGLAQFRSLRCTS